MRTLLSRLILVAAIVTGLMLVSTLIKSSGRSRLDTLHYYRQAKKSSDSATSKDVYNVHLSNARNNYTTDKAKTQLVYDDQLDRSETTPQQQRFQCLMKGCQIMVYSAHYDTGLIKVVGLRHKQTTPAQEEIFCVINNTTNPLFTLHNLTSAQYREGVEYDSWIWQCRWKSKIIPDQVQLVLAGGYKVSLLVASKPPSQGKLLVCVKPMIRGYKDPYQLTEFLEMNRILGVDKVVLYPYQLNSTLVQPVLNRYHQQGFVNLHEWRPPVQLKTLHAGGQKSHNQHCLYTYRHGYKWIAFFDLDELIIPTMKYSSLPKMLVEAEESVSERFTERIAGYNIRSQMCPTALPDDLLYRGENSRSHACQLTSLRKTNCTPPLDLGVWSKPIAVTSGVEVVDIHSVKVMRPGYKVIDLDPKMATVHHYRNNMTGCQIVKQSSWRNVRETSLHQHMEAAMIALPKLCRAGNPLAV